MDGGSGSLTSAGAMPSSSGNAIGSGAGGVLLLEAEAGDGGTANSSPSAAPVGVGKSLLDEPAERGVGGGGESAAGGRQEGAGTAGAAASSGRGTTVYGIIRKTGTVPRPRTTGVETVTTR